MNTPPPALAALGVGLAGGLSSGLFGIGGGLVVVPLLTLALGVPLKQAIGTSLAAMVPVALVGVVTESLVAPQNLHWAAAACIAVGALLGARFGTNLAVKTPSPLLAKLLAALLLIVALRLSGLVQLAVTALGLAGTEPDAGHAGHAESAAAIPWIAFRGLELALGLASGVLSALFGIGGGIVIVPALDAMHGEWGFHACRATSLVVIVPSAALGAYFHARHDHVALRLALALAPGSVLGSAAGVLIANASPSRALEISFAVLLVVCALRLGRKPRA